MSFEITRVGLRSTSRLLACNNCGIKRADMELDSMRKCSRCFSVYYCSISCQKKDHRNHRLECKEVKSVVLSGGDGIFSDGEVGVNVLQFPEALLSNKAAMFAAIKAQKAFLNSCESIRTTCKKSVQEGATTNIFSTGKKRSEKIKQIEALMRKNKLNKDWLVLLASVCPADRIAIIKNKLKCTFHPKLYFELSAAYKCQVEDTAFSIQQKGTLLRKAIIYYFIAIELIKVDVGAVSNYTFSTDSSENIILNNPSSILDYFSNKYNGIICLRMFIKIVISLKGEFLEGVKGGTLEWIKGDFLEGLIKEFFEGLKIEYLEKTKGEMSEEKQYLEALKEVLLNEIKLDLLDGMKETSSVGSKERLLEGVKEEVLEVLKEEQKRINAAQYITEGPFAHSAQWVARTHKSYLSLMPKYKTEEECSKKRRECLNEIIIEFG